MAVGAGTAEGGCNCPGEADTEAKSSVFTAGRSPPSSIASREGPGEQSACAQVLQFAQGLTERRRIQAILQALVFDKAKRARAPVGEHVPRHWKIKAEAVVFYFEFARLPNGSVENLSSGVRKNFDVGCTQTGSTVRE